MNRKNRISGAVALLAAIALPACGPSGAGPDEGGETKVVASNSIVADLVENVAGGEAEVTALVGPGEDVHNFEPSPSASADLSEAAVVFENGLELEPWMDGRPLRVLRNRGRPYPAGREQRDRVANRRG